MVNYKKYLWALAALPMLVSCSSDDPMKGGDPNADAIKDGVYMTVNFTADNGTRSFTNGDSSSDGGTEIGSESENKVNKVLIVLADAVTNKYIACSLVESDTNLSSTSNGTIYQANAKFEKTSLNTWYNSLNGTEPKVNVYICCNPPQTMIDWFGEMNSGAPASTWIDNVYELTGVSDNALWNSTNGFMMTNQRMAPRNLPATIEDWNIYTNESNPFDLSGMNNEGASNEVDNLTGAGAIRVNRVAARLDFRDGSQMGEEDGVTNGNGVKGTPFTYNMVVSSDADPQPLVQATIVRLALVNMLKQEYYAARVSPTGLNENVTIFGAEKPWFTNPDGTGVVTGGGNYVVTPFAQEKYTIIKENFSKYFLYPFFDDATGQVSSKGQEWNSVPVSTIMAGQEDNSKKYRVWRYLTPNTIPGDPKNQTNSQSTGIVFKAKLKGAEALNNSSDKWDKALYAALNNNSTTGRNPYKDPILYLFSGKLYCTWEHVQAAALASAGFNATKGQNQSLDRSTTLYKACYGDGGVGTVKNDDGNVIFTDTKEPDPNSANSKWQAWVNAGRPDADNEELSGITKAFKEAVVGATFTIYQTSNDTNDGWGYYCYYYYWNRHNDNGQSGIMAEMEFAVVRNNVYKLAVTRLSTFGHPRIPENDPDSPDPDTPDEKSDLYLTVSVRVMPWTIRFNNIEF